MIIYYAEVKTFSSWTFAPFVGSASDAVLFLVSVRNTCWRVGYIIGCAQTDILCWLVSCAVSVSIRSGRISELYFLYKVWVSSLQACVLSDPPLYFCISDVNCRTWRYGEFSSDDEGVSFLLLFQITIEFDGDRIAAVYNLEVFRWYYYSFNMWLPQNCIF
jgi:hypothetical protein